MKSILAISNDPGMCTGLGLAGIPGILAHTAEELQQALETADADIGLVIVTAGLGAIGADVLKAYRAKNRLPLITVIPDI